MTACTNNGGSRARRAVTAALVGVLSVGAAPMVALATEAAPVAGDVQVMAGGTYENFSNGKVTLALGANNEQLDVDSLEFVAGNPDNTIVVRQVTCADGTTKLDGPFTVGYRYFTDTNGNGAYDEGEAKGGWVNTSNHSAFPSSAGSYVAEISCPSYDSTAKINLTVRVVNKSLKDAYIFDGTARKADGVTVDTSDTTITYSGLVKSFGNGGLGLAIDGEQVLLNPGSGNQFTATIFESDGVTVASAQDAGNYVAVISGTTGSAYEGSTVKIPFTVEKFDLDGADVTLEVSGAPVSGAITNPSGSPVIPDIDSVEGLDSSRVGDLVLSLENGPAMENGSYTYAVSVDEDATDDVKANYDGTGSVTLEIVDAVVPAGDFWYHGRTFSSTNPAIETTIDFSAEDQFSFDVDEIDVNNKDVDPSWLVVEVVNTKTHEAGDVSMLQTPGQYDVTIKIDPSKCDYKFGGSSNTVTFDVKAGDITDATWYVTYDGVTSNSGSATYTGEDFLDDLTIQVKDANGNVVPSSEYEVVVTKDGKEEVDSIVDHGTYTISLESDAYDVSGCTDYTFTVGQVHVLFVRNTGNFTGQDFLAYTGDVLTPGYEYLVSNDDGVLGNDDDVWATLPEDVYTVSYEDEDGKPAELKEVGEYTANVVISDAKENFVANILSTVVKVSAQKVFTDVPNNEWYSEAVYEANRLGYIGGIGGTTLFAPLNNISRADVACVLYRMAGGSIDSVEEGMTNEELTFISSFEDVDPNAYYAKAVAWTTKMGITNGYGTTFGVGRDITTEEFATMLARYAKVTGVDTSVSDVDAVLAGTPDGDKVTGYAREAVAWAVESGILAKDGNLIDPQGTIYRARVVKIAVDLQPEQLDIVLAPDADLKPGTVTNGYGM